MSRKKIFTDEELVAMVLEHHDSNDDVDSLYGFSESSSDSSFESEGIETPEPDPIPGGSSDTQRTRQRQGGFTSNAVSAADTDRPRHVFYSYLYKIIYTRTIIHPTA